MVFRFAEFLLLILILSSAGCGRDSYFELFSVENQSKACPKADAGYLAGCLNVLENPEDAFGRKLRIFYEVKDRFSQDKPTVLFVQGGPGGPLVSLLNSVEDLGLDNSNYNFMFYDQRGVGRSSALNERNLVTADLRYYHIENSVYDIESLRSEVIKQEKIILIGHSYGSSLVYAYATQFPNNVDKMVVFSGAADGSALATQEYAKEKIRKKILSDIDPADLDALYSLAFSFQLRSNDGSIIHPPKVFQATSDVPEFFAQQQMQRNFLLRLIDANKQKIQFEKQKINKNQGPWNFASSSSKDRLQYLGDTDYDTDLGELVNPIINSFIICNDVLVQENIDRIADITAKDLALVARDRICVNLTLNDSKPFNVRPRLNHIQFPVLVVAGTNDPLVDPVETKRDFELISSSNDKALFLELFFSAHNTLIEEKNIVAKNLALFLDKGFIPQCKD